MNNENLDDNYFHYLIKLVGKFAEYLFDQV